MINEPRFVHYPTMKYPKKIQLQINKVEEVTANWAEEDTEYAVRMQAVSDAEGADARALKAAALAGDPDPGVESSATAARALLYQEERVNGAVRAVNKESAVLARLFNEHRLEIFAQACETAEKAIEGFRGDIEDLRVQERQVEKKRNDGLTPLRWVSSLTDGALSYDPNFPVEGSFELPKTAEQKVVGIVGLLRKIYLDKREEAA